MCKSCVNRCQNIVRPDQSAVIECPVCSGIGCEHCVDGYFEVTECPSQFIGPELIGEIEIATASEHHLPVEGGLLDQSAWWFRLRARLQVEEQQIRDEQDRRRYG